MIIRHNCQIKDVRKEAAGRRGARQRRAARTAVAVVLSPSWRDCSMMQKDPHETARRRWKMLARALNRNREEAENDPTVSVRRIAGFGLIVALPVGSPWFEYRTTIDGRSFAVTVRHLAKDVTPVDLMGFNNTGNVCVWPSEEVLAYHALCDREMFAGKSVLELGGGMTCLAGLSVAKYTEASFVHLTDGNKSSVENVRSVLRRNDLQDQTRVACSVLEWGRGSGDGIGRGEYDLILAADCLFFDDGRKDLAATMWRFLKREGTALLAAPRRGNTLCEFVSEATRIGFTCDPVERYNERVWQRHLQLKTESSDYDEDIHYPILISVRKGPANTGTL